MGLKHSFREIAKPTLGGIGVLILLSLIFAGGYVYVDYRGYLASYQVTQQKALKEAQEKIQWNIENLKKLSVLTSNRIAASQGDLKRIQNILNSSHSLLPDADFLKIQKVTYNKLSKPKIVVTRFGTLPLKPENIPSETPHKKGPSIVFQEKSISCKTWVFNPEGNLEGLLEIHLDPSNFKTMLHIGPFLSFVPNKAFTLLQKVPLPIYGKTPDPFWRFYYKNISHYAVFFLFIILSLIIIVLIGYYLGLRIQKVYKEKLENLKEELSNLKAELSKAQANEDKVKEILVAHQQRIQSLQVTYQSYKKFQTSFKSHQREQANHILRSLDVAMRSLSNPKGQLATKDLTEVIGSSIRVAERISSGIPSKIKNEPIKVIKILNNIRTLFTERIYKSNLTIEMSCSEKLLYHGDPLLIELILVNVIGKPLHVVPKNGKIIIKATDQKDGLQIEVRDNGFPFDEKIQNQIKQSFDFFVSDEVFHQLCQENGLLYECTKSKNGLNIAKIVFPTAVKVSLSDNVIPLFQK
ncbi:MAG: hypothetical protein BGO67_08595 [Alphaproteobacteria bacterium 41-28]|nr:MAG: hypothetical protein BGO67_08595 [Alphaproteobacteria bacterium 41-28]